MHKFLKKYYFINKFDPTELNLLNKDIILIYRNYNIKVKTKNIINFKKYCKKNRRILLISNDFKMALRLDLDGVYLPSFNKEIKFNNFAIKKKFRILGSAHNYKEIRIKEAQKVNEIFISSLFKKKSTFLGFNKFNILNKLTNKKIIALGGINSKNIKLLKLLKVRGYAGISFFQKKKGGRNPPFNK